MTASFDKYQLSIKGGIQAYRQFIKKQSQNMLEKSRRKLLWNGVILAIFFLFSSSSSYEPSNVSLALYIHLLPLYTHSIYFNIITQKTNNISKNRTLHEKNMRRIRKYEKICFLIKKRKIPGNDLLSHKRTIIGAKLFHD